MIASLTEGQANAAAAIIAGAVVLAALFLAFGLLSGLIEKAYQEADRRAARRDARVAWQNRRVFERWNDEAQELEFRANLRRGYGGG